MKRSPRFHKTPVNLSESVSRRLNVYALAAGAAGVGVLALSQPAEAKIVYTPTWVAILPGSPPMNLDLNGDGIADFQLLHRDVNSNYYSSLWVEPQNQSNAIWATRSYASALAAGVRVGSSAKLQPGNRLMGNVGTRCGRSSKSCTTVSRGQWRQTTRSYLGLKFTVQGEIHYGWARLNVTVSKGGVYAALTGYAYETEPNTPIITGHQEGPTKKSRSRTKPSSLNTPKSVPVTLGLLAQGSPGLDVWRVQAVIPVDVNARPMEKR
jgi:hypothetical protein